MVVGSETGAHVPIKSIPHVHRVVTAAAGKTAERVRSQTMNGKKRKSKGLLRYNKVITKVRATISDFKKCFYCEVTEQSKTEIFLKSQRT